MSDHKNLKGAVTFGRPRGSHGPDYAQIDVNDDLSGARVISVRVSLAHFAEALFGLAHVPCTFDFSPDLAGKKREHKEEFVPLRDDQRFADSSFQRANIAAQAFAPFEVDGWKGRVDDLFNHHRHGPDGSRVLFVRYVDPDPAEVQS